MSVSDGRLPLFLLSDFHKEIKQLFTTDQIEGSMTTSMWLVMTQQIKLSAYKALK